MAAEGRKCTGGKEGSYRSGRDKRRGRGPKWGGAWSSKNGAHTGADAPARDPHGAVATAKTPRPNGTRRGEKWTVAGKRERRGCMSVCVCVWAVAAPPRCPPLRRPWRSCGACVHRWKRKREQTGRGEETHTHTRTQTRTRTHAQEGAWKSGAWVSAHRAARCEQLESTEAGKVVKGVGEKYMKSSTSCARARDAPDQKNKRALKKVDLCKRRDKHKHTHTVGSGHHQRRYRDSQSGTAASTYTPTNRRTYTHPCAHANPPSTVVPRFT